MRRRVRFAVTVVALALLALGLVVIRGLAEAVATPQRRETAVVLPSLPVGAAVRVALLSDIHLGNRGMTAARLRAIVGEVDRARPDLIVLAGDFVNGHAPTASTAAAQALVAPLAGLRAPLGIVAVLGNHDHWTAPAAIAAALRRAGVTVLANTAVRRGPFAVLGIDDDYSGHADIAATAAAGRRVGGVPLAITHSPDLVPRLPAGIRLVLAGHTHCGQVVLPWWGPLLVRSLRTAEPLYDVRYRCGVVRDPGRTVIVTAGVGTGSAPVRLGAPPDWWLVTVRGAAPKVPSAAGAAI